MIVYKSLIVAKIFLYPRRVALFPVADVVSEEIDWRHTFHSIFVFFFCYKYQR